MVKAFHSVRQPLPQATLPLLLLLALLPLTVSAWTAWV
jgi:hypothetical protein